MIKNTNMKKWKSGLLRWNYLLYNKWGNYRVEYSHPHEKKERSKIKQEMGLNDLEGASNSKIPRFWVSVKQYVWQTNQSQSKCFWDEHPYLKSGKCRDVSRATESQVESNLSTEVFTGSEEEYKDFQEQWKWRIYHKENMEKALSWENLTQRIYGKGIT